MRCELCGKTIEETNIGTALHTALGCALSGVGNTTAQTRLNRLLKQGLLRFEPRGLTVPRTWYKVKQ